MNQVPLPMANTYHNLAHLKTQVLLKKTHLKNKSLLLKSLNQLKLLKNHIVLFFSKILRRLWRKLQWRVRREFQWRNHNNSNWRNNHPRPQPPRWTHNPSNQLKKSNFHHSNCSDKSARDHLEKSLKLSLRLMARYTHSKHYTKRH